MQDAIPLNQKNSENKKSSELVQAQQPTVRDIDLPNLNEVFADTITRMACDGITLRIEFAVTRFDDPVPDTAISARRYPVARLVLTPGAALDLVNRGPQILQMYENAGLIRRNEATDERENAA